MVLSDLRRGDKFRILQVIVGGAIGKRLVDMGLNRGVEGVFVRCAMMGDPVQIRVRDYNLSLRLAEAAGVAIELLERACPGGHRHGRSRYGTPPGRRGARAGHGRNARRGQGPEPGGGRQGRGPWAGHGKQK